MGEVTPHTVIGCDHPERARIDAISELVRRRENIRLGLARIRSAQMKRELTDDEVWTAKAWSGAICEINDEIEDLEHGRMPTAPRPHVDRDDRVVDHEYEERPAPKIGH